MGCRVKLNSPREGHCMKIIRIRSHYRPHFPAFGLNTKRNGVSLCIFSECREMWARITPNTDTFYEVVANHLKLVQSDWVEM